ncbi:ferredoxin [Kutzneria buriramensis]|uniref:Ferredoxin n=1 Tax=Kutzneria buriramensis TaxID=1045776 RepID=A0A3E0GVI6_9PSEU|nr:ferredoxin [Kutzneria buriramensis]REH27627.1 ferredoxin [Kutzneria buriramensis]
MRIETDRDRCIGAAQCVLSAPTVFDHDDEGLVVVLQDEPAAELREAVRLGQQLCPSNAIRLSEPN